MIEMNAKRASINGVLGVGIAAMAITTWAVFGSGSTTAAAASTVVTAKVSNVLSSVTGTGNGRSQKNDPRRAGESRPPAAASRRAARRPMGSSKSCSMRMRARSGPASSTTARALWARIEPLVVGSK